MYFNCAEHHLLAFEKRAGGDFGVKMTKKKTCRGGAVACDEGEEQILTAISAVLDPFDGQTHQAQVWNRMLYFSSVDAFQIRIDGFCKR